MITPELVSYIRGELGKGRTREEIRQELSKDGGWSDADLSEGFRIVLPMQGFGESAVSEKLKPSIASSVSPTISSQSFSSSGPSSSPSPAPRKILLISAAVLVVGGISFAGWFFRAPLANFWNSGVNAVKSFSASIFGPKENTTNTIAQTPPVVVPPPIVTPSPANTVTVKDCGVGTAPDLKSSATYQNNAVLNCLASSALSCTNARAVLSDPLFPDVFQIIKSGDSCVFALSYTAESKLTDGTGAKLAGQYISCPISSVKAVDETKNPPVFSAPATGNLGKYASQIYFYGTLGVFVESNLDQTRIKNIGCSGPYIDSVIESYRKMQFGR